MFVHICADLSPRDKLQYSIYHSVRTHLCGFFSQSQITVLDLSQCSYTPVRIFLPESSYSTRSITVFVHICADFSPRVKLQYSIYHSVRTHLCGFFSQSQTALLSLLQCSYIHICAHVKGRTTRIFSVGLTKYI